MEKVEMLESEKDSYSTPSESFPKNLNPCRRILFSIFLGLSIILFGVLLAALGYQNYMLWKNQDSLDDLSPADQKIHDVVGRGTARFFKPETNSEGSHAPPNFEFNKDASLNPRCLNVAPNFQTGSKIETTNGTCIRIYSEENCVGTSIAHYPKFTSAARSAAEDAGVMKSVGPCFTNELSDHIQKYGGHSTDAEYQKKMQSSVPEIPDKVDIRPEMTMPMESDLLLKNSTQNSKCNSDSNSTSNPNFICLVVTKSDVDADGNLPQKLLPSKFDSLITSSWSLRFLFKMGKSIARFLSSNPGGTLVLVKIQMDTTSTGKIQGMTTGPLSGFVYRIQFGQSHIQTFYVASDHKYS